MTRYTVTWHSAVENELARLWTVATDRQAITDAANSIDRLLQSDPEEKGESLGDGIRELTVGPLCIAYEASEPDRLVKVTKVTLVENSGENGSAN